MARVSTLIAVLVVAATLASDVGARADVLPTLYVNYTMNCTFSISDDSGKTISSIAPGQYQVLVLTPMVFADVDLSGKPANDMTACKSFVQFQLSGPGVSLSTTLQDGDEDKDTLRATFAPSASYNAVDLNQPSVARFSFTSAATGAAASPAGPASTATGKGQTQQELVGSQAGADASFRGSLDAIVTAGGKLSLTRNGKPVKSLKTGKWTFSVDDESKKAGFTVQALNGKAQTVTSTTFVGSHDATISLKAGRWFFFTPKGVKTTFFVVS